MDKEQIDAIPRKEARQLLAQIPAGPGYDHRVLLTVEQAMNMEWWRGYYAAKNERKRRDHMSQAVNLDIPSAEVRARRSVILNILEELNSHDLTTMQAVDSIDDLVRAAIAQATGRTRAGNDISGI